MTHTDHQPHTTTDQLTDWLARRLHRHGPLGLQGRCETCTEAARALLTSGPLADRLNVAEQFRTERDEAHARADELRLELSRLHNAMRALDGDR